MTPRASNFSIASLITSECCDDENSLYHSLNNPLDLVAHPPPLPLVYPSNEFYSSTPTETIKENRSKTSQVTNLQKSLTTIRNMEGKSFVLRC